MRRRGAAAVAPTKPPASVEFVRVPTVPVLKLEQDDGRAFDGAFVRYAPKLRRAERQAFNVRDAERELVARGARVAVASPVVLPDEVESAPKQAARLDARAEVRAWFADAEGDALAACNECLRILDEVGF